MANIFERIARAFNQPAPFIARDAERDTLYHCKACDRGYFHTPEQGPVGRLCPVCGAIGELHLRNHVDEPEPPLRDPPSTRLDVLAACRSTAFFDDWRRMDDDARDGYRDAVRLDLAALDAHDPLRDAGWLGWAARRVVPYANDTDYGQAILAKLQPEKAPAAAPLGDGLGDEPSRSVGPSVGTAETLAETVETGHGSTEDASAASPNHPPRWHCDACHVTFTAPNVVANIPPCPHCKSPAHVAPKSPDPVLADAIARRYFDARDAAEPDRIEALAPGWMCPNPACLTTYAPRTYHLTCQQCGAHRPRAIGVLQDMEPSRRQDWQDGATPGERAHRLAQQLSTRWIREKEFHPCDIIGALQAIAYAVWSIEGQAKPQPRSATGKFQRRQGAA